MMRSSSGSGDRSQGRGLGSSFPPTPPVPPSSSVLGLSDRPSLTANLPPTALEDNVQRVLTTRESDLGSGVDIRASLEQEEFMSCSSLSSTSYACRTKWDVKDTSLRPVPAFYPPLDPNCIAYVCDASPSVVAVRIAECLRKRSVSVEYDDEAAVASGITADRIRFVVHLYRGNRTPIAPTITKTDGALPAAAQTGQRSPGIDFSHGVIVECQRLRGDVLSFHRLNRAILTSAKGDSDGLDDFRGKCGLMKQSPFGFGRLEGSQCASLLSEDAKEGRNNGALIVPREKGVRAAAMASAAPSASSPALLALEKSLSLLKKDRFDAQILGMESLCVLADVQCSSNIEIAVVSALIILGSPLQDEGDDDSGSLFEINSWIMSLLQHRRAPGTDAMSGHDSGGDGIHETNRQFREEGASTVGTSRGGRDSEGRPSSAQSHGHFPTSPEEDANHANTLRSLALRAFTNALSVLHQKRPQLLSSILRMHCEQITQIDFLSCFLEDLMGAARPPSAVTWEAGTRFGSVHDAALSAECLRLIFSHSEEAKDSLLQIPCADGGNQQPQPLLAALEKARSVGRGTHSVLEMESDRAYVSVTAGI